MTTPSAHSLPRCPVEVTLSLISSRWVGAYFARAYLRNATFRADSQGPRRRVDQGTHAELAYHGGERPAYPRDLRRGAPSRRVHAYRLGAESPEARAAFNGGMALLEYARLHEHRSSVRCDTGEVLIVRRKDDAYVALNEEGDEVARVVPTDATWEAEINNSYRTHVDGAALIAAAEVLTQRLAIRKRRAARRRVRA